MKNEVEKMSEKKRPRAPKSEKRSHKSADLPGSPRDLGPSPLRTTPLLALRGLGPTPSCAKERFPSSADPLGSGVLEQY